MPNKPSFLFLAAVNYGNPISGRSRYLAEILARMGHDVVYVGLPSLRATLRRCLRFDVPASRPEKLRLLNLSPLLGSNPFQENFWTRRWRRNLSQRIRQEMASLHQPMVVCGTPWYAPILLDGPVPRFVYDWMDDVSVHSPGDPQRFEQFVNGEKALLECADLVLTTSPRLARRPEASSIQKKLRWLPNGVSEAWCRFSGEKISREQLGASPGQPIVGFMGALFEWIDFELLADAATELTRAHFVLVGPQRREVSLGRLATLPNVTIHPAVPFAEVPRWIASFDVCTIPFRHGELARAADPIKLYEYSALGKPVVSTIDYPVREGASQVCVAPSRKQFIDGLQQELVLDSPERRQARTLFASRNTWQSRAQELSDVVQEILSGDTSMGSLQKPAA